MKSPERSSAAIFCRGGASEKDWQDWKWQFRSRVHTLTQLSGVMDMMPGALRKYETVVRRFPFCITPYYLSLADLMDKKDPIRLQCFPDLKEIHFSRGGVSDPLDEELHMPVAGIVHRYPDRCLAMVTNTCATYCRHCNRKRRWGNVSSTGIREFLRGMIDYVSRTPSIREVIISGGDPLTMNERSLDWFLGELRAISHVEVLRIGSRMPVVMPMRITEELCAMLRRHRPLWFNTQFNHRREITPDAARACEMLLEAGIPVSNQSVLLKGINDSYEEMQALLHGLQRISVRPYYLFQCEPVRGADHFRVDILKGTEIMERVRKTASGLCIPNYVLDTPGAGGKIPLQMISSEALRELDREHFFDKTGQMD
ncbi:MAG: KamA family radical SAM protein [Deltaproteobacteria bacterium]|nr:KamA family radical SAM protein [Deltaproteobacteria bacterium]